MNYAQRTLDALAEKLPDCEPELLRLYALLALVRGAHTSTEDVHDAWALWRTGTDPGHRSIIPFGELTPDVRELDQPYVDAIRNVALFPPD